LPVDAKLKVFLVTFTVFRSLEELCIVYASTANNFPLC